MKLPRWLLAILALVFILRIPSFFEPYYYGDEMIYMTLGEGVRQGQVLYKDLHDNKPPFLYWTAAIAGNLFMFKVILAFWNLATIIIFWKLADYFMQKNINGTKVATLIFSLLTTLPLFEGNIANAELFMIGPTILAFYILLKSKNSFKNLFISGIFFSIASLFKIPALFEIPAIIIYWLITDVKNWKSIIKNSIILSLGFLIPVVITFFWYYIRGAFNEYLVGAFLQNFSYVKSWKVRDVPMIYRIILIGLSVAALWVVNYKKIVTKRFLFLSLWTLFALFGVTLSGRPYPHYFIQVMAPLSLLLAILIKEDKFEQVLTVIPLTFIFFVPFYYKFWLYPTYSYYQRFLSFSFGKIDKIEYLNSFSPKTSRNYKIADFIANSSKKSDRVFVWDTDSPTIYSLSRRIPPIKYVADYHINDFSNKSDLVKNIENTKPKFIILTNNSPLPEISFLLKRNYILIQKIEDALIYSKISI